MVKFINFFTLNNINRNMIIYPFHIGKVFIIHNGNNFTKLTLTKDMLYHKLGEFVNTRSTTKIESKARSKKRKKK